MLTALAVIIGFNLALVAIWSLSRAWVRLINSRWE